MMNPCAVVVRGVLQASTLAGLLAQLTPLNCMEIQHSLSQTTTSSSKRFYRMTMSLLQANPDHGLTQGKWTLKKCATKIDRLEKKEWHVRFQRSTGNEPVLTTGNDEFADINSNEQNYRTTLSILSELVKQSLEHCPDQSLEMHNLMLFMEEDIGVAADRAFDHTIVHERKRQKLSEQLRGIPGRTISRVQKPVLVIEMKYEHLPLKARECNSASTCKHLNVLYM